MANPQRPGEAEILLMLRDIPTTKTVYKEEPVFGVPEGTELHDVVDYGVHQVEAWMRGDYSRGPQIGTEMKPHEVPDRVAEERKKLRFGDYCVTHANEAVPVLASLFTRKGMRDNIIYSSEPTRPGRPPRRVASYRIFLDAAQTLVYLAEEGSIDARDVVRARSRRTIRNMHIPHDVAAIFADADVGQ